MRRSGSSENLKRTIPGWYLQATMEWPWLSWIGRIKPKKAHQLLADTNTYKPIPTDPSSKLKNKLAQTLRDIETEGELSDNKYKRLYPTSVVAPSSTVYPVYLNLAPQSDSLSLVEGPSHMG